MYEDKKKWLTSAGPSVPHNSAAFSISAVTHETQLQREWNGSKTSATTLTTTLVFGTRTNTIASSGAPSDSSSASKGKVAKAALGCRRIEQRSTTNKQLSKHAAGVASPQTQRPQSNPEYQTSCAVFVRKKKKPARNTVWVLSEREREDRKK